jgi:hypothetical protein
MGDVILQPGDAILTHSRGLYAHLIRFGQRLRWKNTRYNHAALIEKIEDGQIWCIQMARRGQSVRIQDVAPGGDLLAIKAPEGVDRAKAVAYAQRQVGLKYGVLTIFSIAFNILTPRWLRVDVRRNNTLICSALVARSWEHGGWDCPTDPFQITPAELEIMFAAEGKKINA